MTLTTTQEDEQYLKACAALGIDPTTGEKTGKGNGSLREAVKAQTLGKPSVNGNGHKKPFVSEGARRRERREANRLAWIEYHSRAIEALEDNCKVLVERHTMAIQRLRSMAVDRRGRHTALDRWLCCFNANRGCHIHQ